MESLSKLMDAQSHLTQAASNFFDASAAFRSDMATRPPTHASHPKLDALEDTLEKLQHTLDLSVLIQSHVHSSHVMLARLLNESTARVPINRLPSEILGRISSIAVFSTRCFPTHGHRNVLLDLSSVCAWWRQVAINTSSLWSHIDLRIRPFTYVPSLSLLQIFADRCRGTPIHLHLHDQRNTAEKNTTRDLISTLQPYAASLSSLVIFGQKTAPIAHEIFALCSSHGTPDSMKWLAISDTLQRPSDSMMPLPTGLLRGLVHLELQGAGMTTHASLGELVTTVSCCPGLQTLLLKNLWFTYELQREYTPIHLPYLRLLYVHNVLGRGVELFLSILHPDALELNVSLAIDSRDNELVSCVQSLLARSNVVSLSVCVRDMQLSSYIPHTPRLRAIIVNAINWRGPEILEDSLHESVTQLPDLRSLRITHGTLSAGDVDRVKRIVQSKNLRTLGFLSCRFPLPPSSEPLQNEDGDHEHPQVSHGEMPQSMREWLAERVERVIVREIPPVH